MYTVLYVTRVVAWNNIDFWIQGSLQSKHCCVIKIYILPNFKWVSWKVCYRRKRWSLLWPTAVPWLSSSKAAKIYQIWQTMMVNRSSIRSMLKFCYNALSRKRLTSSSGSSMLSITYSDTFILLLLLWLENFISISTLFALLTSALCQVSFSKIKHLFIFIRRHSKAYDILRERYSSCFHPLYFLESFKMLFWGFTNYRFLVSSNS